MICIVTTCMGRLPQLEHCLSTWVERTPFQIVLVDYSCPQRCGDWIEEGEHSDRVQVVRHAGAKYWNPSEARNIGASHARVAIGATGVLFLDTDVFVTDGFDVASLRRCVEANRFGICVGQRDLDGVLLMPPAVPACFNEYLGSMNAFEVIDMKLNLRIGHRLSYSKLSGFAALEHSDTLRGLNMMDSSGLGCVETSEDPLLRLSRGREAAWEFMCENWGRLPLAEVEIEELFCRAQESQS